MGVHCFCKQKMSGTNKKEITIAIPSYNRNDILKKYQISFTSTYK